MFCQGLPFRAGEVTTHRSQQKFGRIVHTKEAECKLFAELVCLLLCTVRLFLCSPLSTSPLLFFFFNLWEMAFPFPAEELLLARLPSRGGLEPCVLPAAPFSWSGCPGAQVSLGKPEMAARQVSCWFPCSSFLLLAEENLISFFSRYYHGLRRTALKLALRRWKGRESSLWGVWSDACNKHKLHLIRLMNLVIGTALSLVCFCCFN